MYPQWFRYCWQQSWFTKMLDTHEFRKLKATAALECQRVMDKFPQGTHHDMRLDIFKDLSEFLKAEIYGAGEIVCKHLITIMSVLGVLPAWLSTIFYIKKTSNNS
jgi:hypothetical protein